MHGIDKVGSLQDAYFACEGGGVVVYEEIIQIHFAFLHTYVSLSLKATQNMLSAPKPPVSVLTLVGRSVGFPDKLVGRLVGAHYA